MQVNDLVQLDSQPLMSSPSPNTGSGSSSQDPFYVYKEVLEEKTSSLKTAVEDHLNVVRSTNTATNPEYKSSKKATKKILKGAEETLKDLQMTVNLVGRDRANFPHISDDEFESRSEFVGSVARQIVDLKGKMNSKEVKDKLLRDEKMQKGSEYGDLGARNDQERENTNFITEQGAQAQVMMRQQDETLEDLDLAVGRVGNMAAEINIELGQQNKMLDELEEDLDEAEERMGVVMGKLGKLLKTKDGCQLWTIISLTLVLVLLTFLVFYT